jgi:type I restriction enzyme, R subunit
MPTYNEADTRAKLIDPALFKREWTENMIGREVTAGEIVSLGGGQTRRKAIRVDYVLKAELNKSSALVTIALIEAKAEHLPPAHGLEQALTYARRMNVSFVYSSNGHQFVEFDAETGQTTKPRPMSEFPTPKELKRRYEGQQGFDLEDDEAAPLLVRYPPGSHPRYYQDAAVRATLEHLAQGRPRALLTLATGAGKTFIAAQLLFKLAEAGHLTRALFVCDRDELRTQALSALRAVFGTDAAAASAGQPQLNARVVVATYQTLGVDGAEADASFLTKYYPENYFSHIIIDECHRSAWGKWSAVLTRNPAARHIGLTATPRRLIIPENAEAEALQDLAIQADNLRYFGEPVYEYTLGQAMEDGYLAACEIIRETVSLDPVGLAREDILAKNPTDARTGLTADPDEVRQHYSRNQFEQQLLLPDRVAAMCTSLFRHLLDTEHGPHQKTIVFCARDSHAQAVAAELRNRYAAWCQQHGHRPKADYAFTCTFSGGREHISNFKGSESSFFIATTVDLLSTGVDVPAVRNIVFFGYLASPIRFSQMVGRGTRLAPGKELFRIYDYTNATRLFDVDTAQRLRRKQSTEGAGPGPTPPTPPLLTVAGFTVTTAPAGHLILVNSLDDQARPVPVDEYRAQLREGLLKLAPDVETLRAAWCGRESREDLLAGLPFGLGAPRVVQRLDELDACDLYDVLARLGYGAKTRTRYERENLFHLTQAPWLNAMPRPAAEVVLQLTHLFGLEGIDSLESTNLFQVPRVAKAGGLDALKLAGKPLAILTETKSRLLAA